MQCSDTIHKVRIVTWVGLILNVALAALKLTAGLLYQSQALVADAIHSISDLVTDVAVLIGVKFWSAPPDDSHPYGHEKIETIVTAFIGIVLALVGIKIGWDAVTSLYDHNSARPGILAFLAAFFSLVSKELLYRWTVYRARQLNSHALEANAWHHRSDAISSIPVVVAVAVAYFYPTLDYVDRVGAFIVSIFIIHAAWAIVKPTVLDLSDTSNTEDITTIKRIASTVNGVLSIHAVRTRMTGTSILVDLHLQVDPDISVSAGHRISHTLKHALLSSREINISDVVTHLEPYDKRQNSNQKYNQSVEKTAPMEETK